MKKITHQIFSAGFSLFLASLLKLPLIEILIVTVLAVWIGILNDTLDFRAMYGIHRNFLTHSPISPLIFVLFLIFLFIGGLFLSEMDSIIFAIILTSDMELHILFDAFNPSGIPLFPGKKYNIKKIPFDDFRLNAIISLIGLFLFLGGILLDYVYFLA